MLQNTTLASILFMCMGSTLLGTSAIFVRLSDLGPLATGFYRMLFALPFLVVWMVLERGQRNNSLHTSFTKTDVLAYVLAGLFFALDLALWNWSIDRTTIVNSTLFNNTAAFYVPFIMWIIFKEKPSLAILVAALIGFIGCSLLVGENFTISLNSVFGDMVALLSGLMVALYIISIKHISGHGSTGFLMFWTGIICTLFLALFGYISGEFFWPLTAKDFVSTFGQAVLVHALGQGLIAFSLVNIQASYAAIILFLAPVTGAVLGWLFYDETLSLLKIIGMLLIMASIIAVRRKA